MSQSVKIDYFDKLHRSGDPAADVERFYRVVERLDTLAHVTQVAAEARVLAAQLGADRQTASLAALAHDLAAVVPATQMIAVAEDMGLHVGGADRAIPMLLHGPIAAAALVDKLDVSDRDLLNAVRYHSTLRAGASTLEKIVFLADKIAYDPTSPHSGEYVLALRAASSLDDAALVYLDFTLDNAWRYGWLLHPNAVAAYRDLTGRSPS
jgi:predicted HD superfamily hydrolase involved in NAD metabolism